MRLLFLSILLCTYYFTACGISCTSSTNLQTDTLTFASADSTLSTSAKEKVKETGLYKSFKDMGKYRALLYLIGLIGFFVALRLSDRLFRITDNLLLRAQHRPNKFDGYHFTGNPYILKSPFYALYHLFLGKSSYLSYLVWPLKYGIAVSFIAAIIIRLFPDEAFLTTESFQALIVSSLKAQVAFGLIFLSFLSITILTGIESFRKTKWLAPLRLAIYLLFGMIIFALIYWLFWFIVVLVILYLVTYRGRDYISRQKHAAEDGYVSGGFIYEPWADGSTKA